MGVAVDGAAVGKAVGVFWPKIFAVCVSVPVGATNMSVGGSTVGGLAVGPAVGTQAMSATASRKGNKLYGFTHPAERPTFAVLGILMGDNCEPRVSRLVGA